MPSSFHGLYSASSALRVFQRQMDVVSHNLANVGTAGYSRQIGLAETTNPLMFFQGGQHSLGSGVGLASITRIRDTLLEQTARQTAAELGQEQARLAGLQQIEGIYGEPSDSGISASLGQFFDAWSGLGSNPSDSAYQLKVQAAGQTLTDKIRGAFEQLSRLEENQRAEASAVFRQVNGLSEKIAELNGQIRSAAASGAVPNDLMDQRDVALRDLSSLVKAEAFPQEDGTMLVYAAGGPLVSGDQAIGLDASFDTSGTSPIDPSVLNKLGAGQLKGRLEALSQTLNQKGQLNQLADSLRDEINALHSGGSTGVDFFAPGSTGAIDFNLSAAVKASPSNISSGTSASAGDGGLAHAIAQLRESKLAGLGTKSFEGFFQDAITGLGEQINSAKNGAESKLLLVQQIEEQVQSVSGVSMDEELTNMLQLQRAYQAAAKTLQMIDSTTEQLLGLIR